MNSLDVKQLLRKQLLTPPKFERKSLSINLANPYSRKMKMGLSAFHDIQYSLWIELEFDRSVVSFNLEPPCWTLAGDSEEKSIAINAASLDINDRLTLHFAQESLKRPDELIKKIKGSPEWLTLNAEIKVWTDLKDSRRLDRAIKNDVLRFLCAPELVVNAQIERSILWELSSARKLCIWDFVTKLKEHDPEEVKTAIANLIVEGKIFLDMAQRFALSSDVSSQEIFHAR